MSDLLAVLYGLVASLGIFILAFGCRRVPKRSGPRLQTFRSKRMRNDLSKVSAAQMVALGLAGALGLGAYLATGWPVAALIGAATGGVAPRMYLAPKQRQAAIEEIEAYAQWTDQLRDLVAASGSIYEAVQMSAPSSPPTLRPHVTQMVSLAATIGLRPAMNWFVTRMDSPYADRLMLGMAIAWESGSRVTEAFESTAKAMRAEVEARRRNEVSTARIWTQVLAILGITVVSVVGMFTLNSAFFDPFGTSLGQVILLVVGMLIFGNVLWVLKLAGKSGTVRLLDASGLPGVEEGAVPSPQQATA